MLLTDPEQPGYQRFNKVLCHHVRAICPRGRLKVTFANRKLKKERQWPRSVAIKYYNYGG